MRCVWNSLSTFASTSILLASFCFFLVLLISWYFFAWFEANWKFSYPDICVDFSRCIVCYSILFFGELHMHGIQLEVQWATVVLNIANSCCLGMSWKYSKDSEDKRLLSLCSIALYKLGLCIDYISKETVLQWSSVYPLYLSYSLWLLVDMDTPSNRIRVTVLHLVLVSSEIRILRGWLWRRSPRFCVWWLRITSSNRRWDNLFLSLYLSLPLSVTWYNPFYSYVYRAGSVALHRLSSQIRYAKATGAMRCSRQADHNQLMPRYVSRVSATRDSVSLWIFMAFKLTNTVSSDF